LTTRAVTNGYWARTPAQAEARLSRLSVRGLKEINFSTGELHQRAVPVQNIVNGCIAALGQGLRTVVNIDGFSGTTFDPTPITAHPHLAGAVAAGDLRVQTGLWVSASAKTPLPHDPQYSVFKTRDRCDYCLASPAVTPDQRLLACCGLRVLAIPELQVGSLRAASLAEVLGRQGDDLFQLWIRCEGPAAILEFVKEHDPDYVLPDGLVHICQACEHLYHDTHAQTVIRSHLAQAKERVSLLVRARRAFEAQQRG